MKPADRIKRLINKSSVTTSGEADKKILGDAMEHLEKSRQLKSANGQPNTWRVIFNRPTVRLAAAAVVLIAAGFAAGRLSSPRPLDMEQLHASLASSLQPAIRQSVLEQVSRDRQLAIAGSNARLKEELDRFKEEFNVQYTRDLNEFAAKTLAVSGAVTNQLLRDLIYRVSTTQLHDRHRIAAALKQIESNRVQDKTELSEGLVGLAELTRIELNRTKQDMAHMLSIAPPESLDPNVTSFPEPQDERNKK